MGEMVVTAFGVAAFFTCWTLFYILEVHQPRVKRRRAQKARKEAVDAQIRLLDE